MAYWIAWMWKNEIAVKLEKDLWILEKGVLP